MNYIATREGVDKRTEEWKNNAATDAQIDLIRHIVSAFPSSRNTLEYGYYFRSNTRGDASEFISSAIENNPQLLIDSGYLQYMALRPRVDRGTGKHGLFSDSDRVLDLDDEVEKLRQFDGNVFTAIVSLKREDAARLGYDNAERWKGLLRAQIDFIAEQYRIPKKDLRWYAAFHNESHHPHIHMLLYSTNDEAPGYISKAGINKLRRAFGTEIFADDLRDVYDQQTNARNLLTSEMRSEFKLLIDRMLSGAVINEKLLSKIEDLTWQLSICKGKKQYGYLPARVKRLVDEIVDDCARDPSVSRLYDLWYQAKCSVTATYITMNQNGWRSNSYVALCSVSEKALMHQLETHPNLKHIVLCLDNDEAGRAATNRITESLAEKGYTNVEVDIPLNKDWDEDLQVQSGVRQGIMPGKEPQWEASGLSSLSLS